MLRVRLLLPCLGLLAWGGRFWAASVVGVLEGWLAVVVEGADALNAVWVDGRAPVRLHHDRDRLLDRLPLAHPHGPLHRLDCCRRVARDLRRDPVRGVQQLGLRIDLVDHPQAVGLARGYRIAGHQHLEGFAWRQDAWKED